LNLPSICCIIIIQGILGRNSRMSLKYMMLATGLLGGCLGQVKSVKQRAVYLAPLSVPIKGLPTWTAGSGVLVALPSGNTGILTNEHVCHGVTQEHMEPYSVVDGRPITGLHIEKVTQVPDLCLYTSIKLSGKRAIRVKDQILPEFAENLLVLGYPNNGPLTAQTGFLISRNLMSIAKEWNFGEDCLSKTIGFSSRGLYCVITMPLNSMTNLTYGGNSGSPVFNEDDELVGLVNSADSNTAQGYFVSGHDIAQFLRGL
jgi:S1-C subfamily serine protease